MGQVLSVRIQRRRNGSYGQGVGAGISCLTPRRCCGECCGIFSAMEWWRAMMTTTTTTTSVADIRGTGMDSRARVLPPAIPPVCKRFFLLSKEHPFRSRLNHVRSCDNHKDTRHRRTSSLTPLFFRHPYPPSLSHAHVPPTHRHRKDRHLRGRIIRNYLFCFLTAAAFYFVSLTSTLTPSGDDDGGNTPIVGRVAEALTEMFDRDDGRDGFCLK